MKTDSERSNPLIPSLIVAMALGLSLWPMHSALAATLTVTGTLTADRVGSLTTRLPFIREDRPDIKSGGGMTDSLLALTVASELPPAFTTGLYSGKGDAVNPSVTQTVTAVPLPVATWSFLAGLMGILALRKKKHHGG